MSSHVSFTWTGQAPSKANFRRGRNNDWRALWKRIKHYERDIGMLAIKAGVKRLAREYPGARVSVELDCYSQNADPDNVVKGTLDGLIGVAFEDDAGVWSAARAHAGRPARVVVTVSYGEAPGRAEG